MTKVNIVENPNIVAQGSIIKIHTDSHYYILARILSNTYTLISIDDGERWTNEPLVCALNDLTIETIERYTDKKISIVKEVTMTII